MDINRWGDLKRGTQTDGKPKLRPTCADFHLSKLFSLASLWKKQTTIMQSITPDHIHIYISISAIFSLLAVIKCASLIARFYEEQGSASVVGSTLIRCCCCCCRGLCTAGLLRRSSPRGFSCQTGQHTSRCLFFDHETAYTAGKEWFEKDEML